MSFREYNLKNPDFKKLGYVLAIAKLNDKHDRSAPSEYHWKILKCRLDYINQCLPNCTI